MNQKEYEVIARAVNKTYPIADSAKRQVVNDIAAELETNYPKTFDRDKFYKACGLEV